MARARNIKPGFFTNDLLAECQPLGRLLFQGLWCHADREGRMEDRPKKFKAEILPYDQCDAEPLLQELEERGFILRYSAGGKRYLQIVNFLKHQNPHVKEQVSEIPAPDLHQTSTGLASNHTGTCPADSLNPITDPLNLNPDSLIPDPVTNLPAPAVADAPRKKPAKASPELQDACRATWEAYAGAYVTSHGTEPVRNAKVSAQVVQLVKRLGATESPQVAAWFVGHRDAFYVRKLHDFGLLLQDAEKLRTEWATGTAMTQTRARQADRAGAMAGAVGEILNERRARA